jgi:hypothetical protein
MRRLAVSTPCCFLVCAPFSPFVPPLIWIESGTWKSEIEGDLVKECRRIYYWRSDNDSGKPNISSTRASICRREGERRVYILIPSTVCEPVQFAGCKQPERFPRDIGGVALLLLLLFLRVFFFSLTESECEGCRNEEGTSVHNSSSPSASTRLSRLRPATVVRLLCFS